MLVVQTALDAKATASIEKAAAYLVKHTRLVHPGQGAGHGLPIAAGVIEGACRDAVPGRIGRAWRNHLDQA
jgi:hypothetical protein